MLKLKFLILFIFFIQVVPNFIELFENEIVGYVSLSEDKCTNSDGKSLIIDTATQCVERNTFLPKDDNGSKCCFYIFKLDPLVSLKKTLGENWKKIISMKEGYDLNISEEEIRKKLLEHAKIINNCRYVKKGSNFTILYSLSVNAIDGIVKYDCGEGQKIFNRNEFHPTNKKEILDKQLIDSFILSYSEKDCLKRGRKLSDDDYQICWCETIKLYFGVFNEKICFPFRISTFQERLKKLMNKAKKENSKEEFKCTCSNKKGTIKGSYNSVTDEVKVE